jgi:hypothetical protein
VQFLLLISHDDQFSPTAKLVDDIHAWDDEMRRRGVLRDGRPLRPAAESATVRVRDGVAQATDGPATAGPSQTAAYELIQCDSLQEALDAAAAHPMAAAGAIEVRQVWDELAGERSGEAPIADLRFEVGQG